MREDAAVSTCLCMLSGDDEEEEEDEEMRGFAEAEAEAEGGAVKRQEREEDRTERVAVTLEERTEVVEATDGLHGAILLVSKLMQLMLLSSWYLISV